VSEYQLVQASPDSRVGFQCYGAARELWRDKSPEVIIAGPFETGKTMAALHKLHTTLCKYPKAQGLILRKTYKSLINSAIVTFDKKVLPYPPEHPLCPVQPFGGKKPEWYDYPNGSRLYLGGMDVADKFLSSEFDMIYVNQAEELALSEWELLTGRATGRAGNMPYAQIMGDCNPSFPEHWIQTRQGLKVLYSNHEDNPILFDPETGEITEQGKETMKRLDALTGIRYKRGRQGLWVQSEGVVFDNFDQQYNVTEEAEYNPNLPVRWGVDDGYVYGEGPGTASYHPRVILFGQQTPQGGINIFDEYVQCGELAEVTLVNVCRPLQDADKHDATRYWQYNMPELAAVDSSATQLRARIGSCGIMHSGGTHKVSEGIKLVRGLICDSQGVRQLKIHPRCVNLIRELQSYAYADNTRGVVAGEPAPKKLDDHCCDALRYLAWSWK
jgi:phage terminase large subunit